MLTRTVWAKCLTPQETFWACLIVMGLQVLPLVLADYPYLDDLWRGEKAGNAWAEQGRVLTDWLYIMLSFGNGAPNLFPLPLLLATVFTALAMAKLTRHYFASPRFTAVLVVLPLWLNPFFLQNLSYQYDGAAMALALACCIWAIVLGMASWQRYVAGIVLVAMAVSFYQVSINVAAALCCIEVMRKIIEGGSFRDTGMGLFKRISQVAIACLIYYLTAYQLMTAERAAMLPVDAQLPGQLLARAWTIAERVGGLITPGTRWFWGGLFIAAVIGLGRALLALIRSDESIWSKLGLVLLLLLCTLAVTLLVYGMMFLFAFFDDGARLLLGFGPFLVMCALLAHRTLTDIDPRLAWLLAVPCLFMLSFSYAYGRVLILQKEMHQSLTLSLVQTITHQPELEQAKHIYILNPKPLSRDQWLPAAEGSFSIMPALRYVLNINYMLTADTLSRYGLTQVIGIQMARERLLALSPTPWQVSTFFDIHLFDSDAYVVIKVPKEGESHTW